MEPTVQYGISSGANLPLHVENKLEYTLVSKNTCKITLWEASDEPTNRTMENRFNYDYRKQLRQATFIAVEVLENLLIGQEILDSL